MCVVNISCKCVFNIYHKYSIPLIFSYKFAVIIIDLPHYIPYILLNISFCVFLFNYFSDTYGRYNYPNIMNKSWR